MYNISIDIGGTHIRSALLKKNGNLVNLIKKKSTFNIVDDIIEHLIIQTNSNSLINIKSIGISIGGCIDRKSGSILNVSKKYTKWNKIDLINQLKKKKLNVDKLKSLNLTVYIDNDGNCAAHAEKYYGNAIGCKNFVTLVLGTGVGIGCYINNCIIQYSEIGSFIEDKCSGKYFDSLEGDKKNKYLEGAKYLGLKIAEIISLLCPDKFIISGPLLKIGDFFIEEIKLSVMNNLNGFNLNRCELIISDLENQGLLGANCLNNIN